MKHYIADIGSWDKGKTESFTAENRSLAVIEAFRIRDLKNPQGDVVCILEKVSDNQYKEFWNFMKGRTDQ